MDVVSCSTASVRSGLSFVDFSRRLPTVSIELFSCGYCYLLGEKRPRSVFDRELQCFTIDFSAGIKFCGRLDEEIVRLQSARILTFRLELGTSNLEFQPFYIYVAVDFLWLAGYR